MKKIQFSLDDRNVPRKPRPVGGVKGHNTKMRYLAGKHRPAGGELHYSAIIKSCLEAWNKADATLVASYYCDNLDYRDPTVPKGILNKNDFIKYLQQLFSVWPQQKWILKNVYPHSKEGSFTIDYDFRIANNITSIEGWGIDRMEFSGDKVRLNHVYLNADNWKDWVKNELKKAFSAGDRDKLGK
jgi:hypothetical protein